MSEENNPKYNITQRYCLNDSVFLRCYILLDAKEGDMGIWRAPVFPWSQSVLVRANWHGGQRALSHASLIWSEFLCGSGTGESSHLLRLRRAKNCGRTPPSNKALELLLAHPVLQSTCTLGADFGSPLKRSVIRDRAGPRGSSASPTRLLRHGSRCRSGQWFWPAEAQRKKN